jgi:hypothetical protein
MGWGDGVLFPNLGFTNDLRVITHKGRMIAQRKRWWFPVWIRCGKETEKNLLQHYSAT